MTRAELALRLESLHAAFHRPEYIHPDPLETVLRYRHPRDQEVSGLVAATLAYGRASQILVSIDRVLGSMGDSPFTFTRDASPEEMARAFAGFRHRWTSEEDVINLVLGMQRQLTNHGSLEASFNRHLSPSVCNRLLR